MADPLTHYADHVVRVTLSGKMLGGAEEWQTGFFLGKTVGPAGAPTQATADAIRDLWVPFFTNFNAGFSSSYSFEQVKLAEWDVNGKYVNPEPIVSSPAVAVNGGSGGNPLPPQLALVATLVAGSGKGLAGKGRMYLPGIKFGVDGGGHIAPGDCTTIANGLKTFFQGIYNLAAPEGVPINASRGHKASLGIGARNVPINGVKVGNVYDTQRRRRNALQETYTQSGLIGP